MNCCTNILHLGTYRTCEGYLPVGITSTAAGNHVLKVDYLGSELSVTQSIAAGAAILFDISNLNEEYEFTAKLFAPDGGRITKQQGSVVYDCFRFRTSPTGTFVGTAPPDGGSGGDGIDYRNETVIAGETLSGGRAVYITGGKAYLFNPAAQALYGRTLGITKGAALANDEATVQLTGVMAWPDNNLTAGALYYAGANGILTTNPAGLTVLQRVGHAIAANKLKLSFDLNIVTI